MRAINALLCMAQIPARGLKNTLARYPERPRIPWEGIANTPPRFTGYPAPVYQQHSQRTSGDPFRPGELAAVARDGITFQRHAANLSAPCRTKEALRPPPFAVDPRWKDAEVTGRAWLAGGLAALMLLVAASCTARLVIWRLRGRPTEPDADVLHVLMGVAMAGMLEPQLSPVPGTIWQAVFATAAAWFGWHAIGARGRRTPGSWRCAHPAPHAVECAAMVYMLQPARQAGHAPAMTMPGPSQPGARAGPRAFHAGLHPVGHRPAHRPFTGQRPRQGPAPRRGPRACGRDRAARHQQPAHQSRCRTRRYRQGGTRPQVRRLLQDHDEHRHGLHAHHIALSLPEPLPPLRIPGPGGGCEGPEPPGGSTNAICRSTAVTPRVQC